MPRSLLKMLLEVTLGCFRLLNVAFLGCSMLLEVFFENFPHATFSNLLFATSGNLKQLYVTLRNLRYFARCTLNPEPGTLKNVTSHLSPGLKVPRCKVLRLHVAYQPIIVVRLRLRGPFGSRCWVTVLTNDLSELPNRLRYRYRLTSPVHSSPVSKSQSHNVKLKIPIPKIKINPNSPNHKF